MAVDGYRDGRGDGDSRREGGIDLPEHVLAIDQGTTSTRAIVYSPEAKPVGSGASAVRQIYPRPGWVEHDPEELFQGVIAAARQAVGAAGITFDDIVAIGITNQRETTVIWERSTGRPVANAIVWQCRRTADACAALRAGGHGDDILRRTGLVIDPYFSATKIAWLLERTPGGRKRAAAGELCFGTVDSWLLYRLTGGEVHATDATNASRTMLLNIHNLSWDDSLLSLFDIPARLLPEVRPSASEFGHAHARVFGVAGVAGRSIPISGMAGDQSAALYGQACFTGGMAKCTYGTGAFILVNAGGSVKEPPEGLITTVGWRTGRRTVYALEGSVFVTGAAVQWLRDQLGVIDTAADSDALAQSVPDNGGVYFVPAFTGLGAPYWDPDVRGAIVGLTGGTHRAYLARAALEATAYQVKDVFDLMAPALRPTSPASRPHGGGRSGGRHSGGGSVQPGGGGVPLPADRPLRADGGQSANEFLMQFQADILGRSVEVAAVQETTALGAAFLAGRTAGVWGSEAELASLWKASRVHEPKMSIAERLDLHAGWKRAVAQARHRPAPADAALL